MGKLKILTTIIIILIILAGGAAFWLNSLKNSDKKEGDSNSSSSNSNQTVSPEKVYDITEILKDFESYEGKEITLEGNLVHAEQGYILASTQNNSSKNIEGNAILVDFSKNEIENPDKYAIQGSDNPNPPATGSAEAENSVDIKPPVTIRGKLIIKTQAPVIEVISITSN